MIFNIGSTTLFIHSHHINETTIAHSHPFAGRPDSHHHSSASLILIARQTISEMRIAQTMLLLDHVDNYSEFMQSTAVVIQKSQFHVDQASLRAPPVA